MGNSLGTCWELVENLLGACLGPCWELVGNLLGTRWELLNGNKMSRNSTAFGLKEEGGKWLSQFL